MTTSRVSRFVAIGAAGFVVQMTAGAALLASRPHARGGHAARDRGRDRDQPRLAPPLGLARARRRPALAADAASCPPRRGWHLARRRRRHGRRADGPGSAAGGAGARRRAVRHRQLLDCRPLGVCEPAARWSVDLKVAATLQANAARLPAQVRQLPTGAAATLSCLLLLIPGQARAAGPSREALQSWEQYASALDRARAADLARGVPAWATDDDPRGARVQAAVSRGEIAVTRRSLRAIDVDDATLEHWQGSMLVRGVTLAQVAQRLRHPDRFPQPSDVVSLKVGGWSDNGHDLYLAAHALDADLGDVRHLASRAAPGARSDATGQHQPGDAHRGSGGASRDFLWRMQSFWRFTAVPEGVIVTCESISLSRPVPIGLGLVSRPIIARVARESMTTAVRAWQAGWTQAGA